jgi:thymidylate synthase
MLWFEGLETAYMDLLARVADAGVRVSPRGFPTRELDNVIFKIENPRNRLLTNMARKWNYCLAFGELAWHLGGSRDVEALASYAQIWRRYAVNAQVKGSCYGHRMFSRSESGLSQWELCKAILQEDSASRRAVIQLYDPQQNYIGSPDVSCALSLQFTLRNKRLDLTVCMRSNDVYFGLPYDVYLYTNLLELMAVELGVDVGTYVHFAGSLHVYDKDLSKIEKMTRTQSKLNGIDIPLTIPGERIKYCEAEASIRLHNNLHQSITFSDDFWRQKYLFLLADRSGCGNSFYHQFFQS